MGSLPLVAMDRVLFFVIVLCFIKLIDCAIPHDVEFIPEEMRTAGAEKLGPSLSLGIGKSERRRRDRVDKSVKQEVDIDQTASGSEILSPGFDVGYGELGQQVYGDQHKGQRYYQRQDAGGERGEVGFYGNAGRRGSAGQVAENAYVGNHEAAHGDRADAGYYGNAAGGQQGYDVGKSFYGQQALNRKGLAAVGVGAKGGYRKGHHSSGFRNSYHKDESGNNTSYYDEAIDDGGHFLLDARDGAFNDQGGSGYKGAFQDSAFINNANGNQGQYGAAQGFNNAQGHNGNYGRGEYFGNAEDYGQKKGNERYDKNVNYGQAEGGDAVYGKVGEGYGRLVNRPVGVYAYVPKQVPVIYGQYVQPGNIRYPVQGKDYYHYPSYDYYPVGSYGPASSDHYEKTYVPVKEPIYDGITGTGTARYLGFTPYVPKTSEVSEKYFGTYRGVTY